MRKSGIPFVLALAILAVPALAQTPYLVEDINTVPDATPGLSPAALTPAQDFLYFTGDNGVNGRKLFRTTGTPSTTLIVRDGPAPYGGAGAVAATLGNVGFFAHLEAASGNELWSTDGSALGTRIVRDLNPGPASSDPAILTSAGGLVYFLADGGTGRALWRTNGSAAGTFPVYFGDVQRPTPGDGALFFTSSTPASGSELWTSDGTALGTKMVKDLCPGPCNGAGSGSLLTPAGPYLFFVGSDGQTGPEVWRTDGTAVNTVLAGELVPGPNGPGFEDMEAVGNVLFVATRFTPLGLWRFGPLGPPQLLAPGVEASHLAVSGNRLFFFTESFDERRLWRSDGTAGGTIPVATVCTTPCFQDFWLNIVGSSQYAFFTYTLPNGQGQLASNDGTPGGTVPLAPVSLPILADPVIWNDRLFFGKGDLLNDELWTSDGTIGGTLPVFELVDASAHPHGMVVAQDRVFFQAENPGQGLEWWVTGATEPTHVLDLVPGPEFFVSNSAGALGRDLLFSVDGGPGIGTFQLWKSDGTLPGTGSITDVRSTAFSELGGIALFDGAPGFSSDHELWRTDGTTPGTLLVMDIDPGPDSSNPRALATVGGQQFLAAAGELWRTDGTTGGTALVKDIRPTSAATLGSTVLLSAVDATGDHELWRSDGTPAGTTLVKDIYPGLSSNPRLLTAAGNKVFLVAGWPGVTGWLGTTDGTEAGTTPLPGSPVSIYQPLTQMGGVAYFLGTDTAHGHELWRSDGTDAGTHIVKDVMPGPESGFEIESLDEPAPFAAGGRLWFSAFSPETGLELWRSDGTAAGTVLHADIAPGPSSSVPRAFRTDGNRLYFVANDGSHGFELWAVDLAPAASVADAEATEGDAAGAAVTFDVRISLPASTPVTVSYATENGSAVAGLDYVAQAGVITFTPGGPESAAVTVPLLADIQDEPEETFVLRLTAPATAPIRDGEGVATIHDDDAPSAAVRGTTVTEGDGGVTPASFQVELTTKDGLPTSQFKYLEYETERLTASPFLDFTPVSGALSFLPGTASGTVQTVSADVIGDTLDEPDERFVLRIAPSMGLLAANDGADALITDDDGGDAGALLEFAHGVSWRRALSDGLHAYAMSQAPFTSYEVVVDEVSGDLTPLALERLAAGGTLVLQSGQAVGTGSAVSLRWRNESSATVSDQEFRVRSGGCGIDCADDDMYRVRVYETTLSAPRFNNNGSQVTVMLLQNTTDTAIGGRILFWLGPGSGPIEAPFALSSRQALVLNTATAAPASAGAITVTHDGPYGSLVGKAVSLEPGTGFSFDTPLTSRPR